jgi:hypothetical protein
MSRRAFVLPELAAVLVVVLLVLALALPAARAGRRASWDVVDGENLHRFAEATVAFAADNTDSYWTFSWKQGMDLPTDYPDLKNQNSDDLSACRAQAIDILRRKAGREDIQYISGWFCHPFYSQLPLYDYLDAEMPALWGVCPADRIRLQWAGDPEAFDNNEFWPCQPQGGDNASKRWPYSSSYELSTSFFDQGTPGVRIAQSGAYSLYSIPGGHQLTPRRLGDTRFPSQKVHLYESAQHHVDEDVPDRCQNAQGWYVPDSRVAALFSDGHAALAKTAESNRGWQPNSPTSQDPTFLYGEDNKLYVGAYRWTRGYLDGRDFGGPEVGPP